MSATSQSRHAVYYAPPRQQELLQGWGYPYVLDEFRFHMTNSVQGPTLS